MQTEINKDPIFKSTNNTNKILLNILVSLFPIIIYKTILTNYSTLIFFLIISFINIIIDIIIDLIIKNKKYKFNFFDYLLQIIILFIIYLFIPNIDISNILYIGIINQIILVLNKFFKAINPVSLFFLFYYIILNNSIKINYNIYILSIIIVFVLTYLIMTKSIKFRISITFIIITSLSLILKNNDINFILLFAIYGLTYLFSSPLMAFSQYLYALLLGLVFVFMDIKLFIILVFLLSFVIKYLDLYYGIYSSKKKSY